MLYRDALMSSQIFVTRCSPESARSVAILGV